jgi:Spy/CpxP family protein refolding chaperone
MKKKFALIGVIILAGMLMGAMLVSAQQQPPQQPEPQSQPKQPRPPHPPNDPLADAMFPPELIMQHTRDLGLTEDQKTYMRGEIQKTTTRFNELQWQLQDSMEALHATVKANPVNEQLALSQLDKVLDTEREIKRLHFGLAISIKNKLTAEQQTKLQEMMRMRHGPDGPGPGGPGRGPGGPGPGPGGPGGPGPGPGGPGGPGPGPGGPPKPPDGQFLEEPFM